MSPVHSVQLLGASSDWEWGNHQLGNAVGPQWGQVQAMGIHSRSFLRHRDSPLLPWHGGTRLACPSGDMGEVREVMLKAVRDTGQRDYTCLQPGFVFLGRRRRWFVKATLL